MKRDKDRESEKVCEKEIFKKLTKKIKMNKVAVAKTEYFKVLTHLLLEFKTKLAVCWPQGNRMQCIFFYYRTRSVSTGLSLEQKSVHLLHICYLKTKFSCSIYFTRRDMPNVRAGILYNCSLKETTLLGQLEL